MIQLPSSAMDDDSFSRALINMHPPADQPAARALLDLPLFWPVGHLRDGGDGNTVVVRDLLRALRNGDINGDDVLDLLREQNMLRPGEDS